MNEADRSRLEILLDHAVPPPYPDFEQGSRISELLTRAVRKALGEASHVGIGDRISLVSPEDPSDVFQFAVAMPREADVDADRISVCHPLCLAVLGRGCGEEVAWETPKGSRRMRIAAIQKVGAG